MFITSKPQGNRMNSVKLNVLNCDIINSSTTMLS